jgi:hypothetical protein
VWLYLGNEQSDEAPLTNGGDLVAGINDGVRLPNNKPSFFGVYQDKLSHKFNG